MQSLLSFYNHDASLFSIEADLSLKDADIYVEFKLKNLSGIFDLPTFPVNHVGVVVERLDELWKNTCFEVFLSPEGGEEYYEFNFSLKPAWNVYHFEAYRKPQPPRATEDFVFKNLNWNPTSGRLILQLKNKTPHRSFCVGLAAILQEKSMNKHYCALAHKGDKPDFHLRESFTLLRRSTT